MQCRYTSIYLQNLPRNDALRRENSAECHHYPIRETINLVFTLEQPEPGDENYNDDVIDKVMMQNMSPSYAMIEVSLAFIGNHASLPPHQ
jgi:hypothetical protein